MPVMDGFQASLRIRELEVQYKLEDGQKHFICGHSSEANRRKFVEFDDEFVFRDRNKVPNVRYERHHSQAHEQENPDKAVESESQKQAQNLQFTEEGQPVQHQQYLLQQQLKGELLHLGPELALVKVVLVKRKNTEELI